MEKFVEFIVDEFTDRKVAEISIPSVFKRRVYDIRVCGGITGLTITATGI
jgi:hypothetical protein